MSDNKGENDKHPDASSDTVCSNTELCRRASVLQAASADHQEP